MSLRDLKRVNWRDEKAFVIATIITYPLVLIAQPFRWALMGINRMQEWWWNQ